MTALKAVETYPKRTGASARSFAVVTLRGAHGAAVWRWWLRGDEVDGGSTPAMPPFTVVRLA